MPENLQPDQNQEDRIAGMAKEFRRQMEADPNDPIHAKNEAEAKEWVAQVGTAEDWARQVNSGHYRNLEAEQRRRLAEKNVLAQYEVAPPPGAEPEYRQVDPGMAAGGISREAEPMPTGRMSPNVLDLRDPAVVQGVSDRTEPIPRVELEREAELGKYGLNRPNARPSREQQPPENTQPFARYEAPDVPGPTGTAPMPVYQEPEPPRGIHRLRHAVKKSFHRIRHPRG